MFREASLVPSTYGGFAQKSKAAPQGVYIYIYIGGKLVTAPWPSSSFTPFFLLLSPLSFSFLLNERQKKKKKRPFNVVASKGLFSSFTKSIKKRKQNSGQSGGPGDHLTQYSTFINK